MGRFLAWGALAAALAAGQAAWAGSEAAIDTAARGAALFKERCSTCHDHPTGRIPPRYVLSHKSTDQVIQALTKGVMRANAEGLSRDDIGQLATFITYKTVGAWPEPDPAANHCQGKPSIAPAKGDWADWGLGAGNMRFQAEPGFVAADVPRLRLKWAFALPGSEVVGQPTRLGDLLLVPSVIGRIFALDARTGCTYWSFEAGAPVKNGLAIGSGPGGRLTAFFGDMSGTVRALDALSGKLLWSVKADPHPLAQVRGSPKLFQGRLYVPVSSGEESAALDTHYRCCTFRGEVVALDAETGKKIWRAYTIAGKPRPFKKRDDGQWILGPSGASTWSSPTIDAKRGRIYVGTGNGYSGEDTGTMDAIVAFDLKTGRRLWATQWTKSDVYVVCQAAGAGNCPDKIGEDVDFGSSSVLVTLPDGHDMLMAGQKSGMAFGFDPDDGHIVWKASLGVGGVFGGIEHGVASDGVRLYAPISDIGGTSSVPQAESKPHPEGGVYALDAATGKVVWHTPAPAPVCSWGTLSCAAAQPSTPTAIPGILFSGSLDGHIRAYGAEDGKILWAFDTGRNFDAVNGGQAHGGAVTGYGQIVSGGMLYVNAGGGYYGPAGNALLAFSVEGK